jgi:uncharacterized protein (DUF885 family)
VTSQEATHRYRQVAATAVEELLDLEPERATVLGDHRLDDRLDDLSEAGLADRSARLRDAVDAVDSLDLDGLDPEDAVDAELLRTALDRRLLDVDVVRRLAWDPLAWLPTDALHLLLARDTVLAADRLRALAGRLEAVPERLALARRTVERPPRPHVETACDRSAAAARMVREDLPALLAAEPGLAGLVEPPAARAAEAFAEHAAALAVQAERADGDPRLGPAVFPAALHLALDTELSADDIVRRAHDHLDVVTEQLVEAAGAFLGRRPGSEPGALVREALDRVALSRPDDTTVVARARAAYDDAVAATRRLDLVSVHDDPVEVQVMPESRRGVAVAYCDAPGPLERGGTTAYAIAPPPGDWSPERVASFYAEYNDAMLGDLSVHEGAPGHAVQLGHARRFRGSTPVRALTASSTFLEGWAVHAERLLAEAGHGGPAVRLQQLKMQLRMTINALLDAGVHAGGMTEGEALHLMVGRGFQTEGEAVGKWRRALLTSTQLSTYFTGYVELGELFAGLAAAGRLSGARPYDAVLAHGSPPPRHLRRLLDTSR